MRNMADIYKPFRLHITKDALHFTGDWTLFFVHINDAGNWLTESSVGFVVSLI